MPKSSKRSAPGGEISPLLAYAVAELTGQIDICRVRREALVSGGFDKDLANCAAALGRAITGLAGEQRQQEKHVRDMVARMTEAEQDSLVVEYVRGLTPERRGSFRALLDDLDRDEQVLGLQ